MYRVSVYNQQSAFLVRYLTCFFFVHKKSSRAIPSPSGRGASHARSCRGRLASASRTAHGWGRRRVRDPPVPPAGCALGLQCAGRRSGSSPCVRSPRHRRLFFFFFLVEVIEAQRGQGTRPKPHSYGEVDPGPEPCVGFVRRAL